LLLAANAVKAPVPEVWVPAKPCVVLPVLKLNVVVVHCPKELKEVATEQIAIKVKILLMTIKFKFKRFGYESSVGITGKYSQNDIRKMDVEIAKDTDFRITNLNTFS